MFCCWIVTLVSRGIKVASRDEWSLRFLHRRWRRLNCWMGGRRSDHGCRGSAQAPAAWICTASGSCNEVEVCEPACYIPLPAIVRPSSTMTRIIDNA